MAEPKPAITSFTQLLVWQEGHKLVLMAYKATKSFPVEERYCLTNQIRRAVVSITSNIAEGFSRKSSREKAQFYNTSLGSLTEAQNQFLIAKDLSYMDRETFNAIEDQTTKVSKLTNGLIKSMNSRIKK